MSGGRLTSQQIDGQEYPPFLLERTPPGGLDGSGGNGGPDAPAARTHRVRAEFAGLHDEEFLFDALLAGVAERQLDLFFAAGLEHGPRSSAGEADPVPETGYRPAGPSPSKGGEGSRPGEGMGVPRPK